MALIALVGASETLPDGSLRALVTVAGETLIERQAARLADVGVAGGGPIRLLCMPRVLGYGFNPLSVYFCHDVDERLTAILYEVRNTFGQRHSYLIATP